MVTLTAASNDWVSNWHQYMPIPTYVWPDTTTTPGTYPGTTYIPWNPPKKCNNPYCPHEHQPPVTSPELWPTGVPHFDYATEEERCLVRQFFKAHPDAGSCMISCPCRLCTPYCM